MADYIYSGSFPASPATNDTLSMNGVGYVYTSNNTWKVTSGNATVADGSITTAKLLDDNVTADKLANTINTDIATGVSAQAAAISTASADATTKADAAQAAAEATAAAANAALTHDGLTGFVANEHLDWTTDRGATNIHAGNYTDTDTVYTHPAVNHLPSGGTSGQVLTNTAAGNGTWQDAGGGFDSGTKMVFNQTSAPTGWTKITSNNDAALRVVSGSVGTGGSAGFSSPAHGLSAGSHTLTTSQMPSHTHSYANGNNSFAGNYAGWGGNSSQGGNDQTTGSTGGGSSHSHSLSGSITTPKYVDVIVASKD